MTWTTKTTYVDLETGEEITKNHIDKKLFVKIKHETKYEKQNNWYGIRYVRWECERNRQTEIKF